MAPAALLAPLAPLVVLAQEAPDDEDVVAGWTAFVIFILLILAVVVLGFSLTKRLKNVDRAAAEGKYDPSRPRRGPARGLAAARELRERTAAAEAAEAAERDGRAPEGGEPPARR